MGIRAGRHVIDVLFDLWFRAVHNEQIPSLSYWKTLSTLCKRWRHNVRFFKNFIIIFFSFLSFCPILSIKEFLDNSDWVLGMQTAGDDSFGLQENVRRRLSSNRNQRWFHRGFCKTSYAGTKLILLKIFWKVHKICIVFNVTLHLEGWTFQKLKISKS